MTTIRPFVHLVAAVGLFIAAAASWSFAARARQDAEAHARVATLQDRSDYWAGRYDVPSGQASPRDAGEMLTAANGVYRKGQRSAMTVDVLDQAAQAYAGVLRNGGFNRDAAFNYEYVVRLRDALSTAKSRLPRTATPAPPGKPDDLPSGRTIHGRPGTHPPDTRGEEFEVLTPMDYGEREAQPEPTSGRPLPRKG